MPPLSKSARTFVDSKSTWKMLSLQVFASLFAVSMLLTAWFSEAVISSKDADCCSANGASFSIEALMSVNVSRILPACFSVASMFSEFFVKVSSIESNCPPRFLTSFWIDVS